MSANTTSTLSYTFNLHETSAPQTLMISFLFFLLLHLSAMSQCEASVLSATTMKDGSAWRLDTAEVGYRSQWSKLIRTNANQAYDNSETYLALRLWQLLAEQGDNDAAFKLGHYYDIGEDGDRDAILAVYWYRRAAEAGNIHAQHNLAVAYANGDGVPMNITTAIKWWTLAARYGNTDSQYNLGILYAMGVHGIKKDIEKAKSWWRKAALRGDPMAQYNLGTLYINGDVISYCEATRWWEESAKNGVQQASWALQVIKTRQDYRACW